MKNGLVSIVLAILLSCQSVLAAPGSGNSSGATPNKSSSASDALAWVGNYLYVEDAGKNAGGSAMIIERKIKVEKKRAGVAVSIESEGYQTDEKLVCDTTFDGGKMTLLFRSYPNGKLTNDYDVQVYKKGAKLLSLQRTTANGRNKILTFWGEFKPNDERLKSGKVYFERTKS